MVAQVLDSGLDNINYVGFGKTDAATGRIDNFLLQDGQASINFIPEPSTMVLFIVGGVLVGLRRRKLFA